MIENARFYRANPIQKKKYLKEEEVEL